LIQRITMPGGDQERIVSTLGESGESLSVRGWGLGSPILKWGLILFILLATRWSFLICSLAFLTMSLIAHPSFQKIGRDLEELYCDHPQESA